MKFFLILLIVAVAKAQTVDEVLAQAKAIQNAAIQKQKDILNQIQSMMNAIGKRDAVTDILQGALKTLEQTALGKLQETLGGLLGNILGRRDVVEQSDFFGTLKNIVGKIGEVVTTGVKAIAPAAGELLKNLAPSLISALPSLLAAAGKREASMDTIMAHVKTEIDGVVDKVKDSVEDVEKLSKNLMSNLEAAAKGIANGDDVKVLAKLVVDTLEKDVFQMMVKGTFEFNLDQMIKDIVPQALAKLMHHPTRRGLIIDILNGLKNQATDILGLLHGTAFGDLHTFVEGLVSGIQGKLAPTISTVKALAQQVLSHAGQFTAQLAQKAVALFQPFASTLGPLFTKIQALATKLIPS